MRLLMAAMVLVLGTAAGAAGAQSLQPVPKLESRVTDLTGTLTAGQQAELEQKVAHYLAHPEEARAIADAGRRAVLERHTISQRVGHMLDRAGISTQ